MDSPLAVYRDVGLLRGVEVAVVPSLRVVVVLHNKMDAHVKISIQVRVHVQVHVHVHLDLACFFLSSFSSLI